MNVNEFLEGRIILERKNSEYNGELTVVRDFVFGTYIMGGGLPQSGGLAEKIWRSTLLNVKQQKPEIKNCLILGLGGGGIAKLIREFWGDEVKITGVDIDPVIVELGKKYLKLLKQGVDIKILDVSDFETSKKYDLICVDTYVGDEFPKKFESEKFANKVKSLLGKDGIAIFNRLFGPEDRKLANAHEEILEKVFASVERNFPEANVMFICKANA